MAISVNVLQRGVARTVSMYPAIITFDNSYPNGGYPVTASQFNINTLRTVIASRTSRGDVVRYSPGSRVLMVFTTSGTAVADGTDLSTVTCQVLAVGN